MSPVRRAPSIGWLTSLLVAYTTADAREQLLSTLAQATEDLGLALASLSEAYELLDESSAERLEQGLFRPVQLAYGRARRTHAEFAERHGLSGRTFEPASPGAPSKGVKGFLDSAVHAVSDANGKLATLQDSMLPVEVGDPQLRAGLEEVRGLIDHLGAHARELERPIGR
jgi:hypothetical protein